MNGNATPAAITHPYPDWTDARMHPSRWKKLLLKQTRRRLLSIAAILAVVAGSLVIRTAWADDNPATVPAVVARYAPIVRLAPGERYTPVDAAAYLAKTRLGWANDGRCDDDPIAGWGEVNPAKLGSGGYHHRIANKVCRSHGAEHPSNALTRPRQGGKCGVPENEGFFLELADGNRAGHGNKAPTYYEYAPKHYVTYWFFYAYNDARKPSNLFDHEGDWERISVRLDQNDRATSVLFFQHEDAEPLDWPQVSRLDGRPLVYSARGTHASYSIPGKHTIAEGFSTDFTGAGLLWDTSQRLRSVRDQSWYGYGGAWGQVGNRVGQDLINKFKLGFVGPGTSTGPLGPSKFKAPDSTRVSAGCATQSLAGTSTDAQPVYPAPAPTSSPPPPATATPETCHWTVRWPSAGVYGDPSRDAPALKSKHLGDVVGPYCETAVNAAEQESYVKVSTGAAADGVGWMRLNALVRR